MATRKPKPLPGGEKPVTDQLTVAKFQATANDISGTSSILDRELRDLEIDLKKDKEGLKDYQDYLKLLELKKADLQKRINENKEWIAGFERNNDGGAFEVQYKRLVDSIDVIYKDAKSSHASGIDMLIKNFSYHPVFKRHSDTFTAVPFRPK